ncbi:YegP family protein [Streptomyces sp. NPDC057686]|uniref:YegP family protein n=1 Tax=Streptomyces sp. NPDC057686 TaxID=3346212 RepID=UPI0036875596
MAGTFELYKDKAGQHRFRLKAGNGEIIAVGEAYNSKAAAEKGIQSVKAAAPDAPVKDLEIGKS